jgi:outer membrane protein TolC
LKKEEFPMLASKLTQALQICSLTAIFLGFFGLCSASAVQVTAGEKDSKVKALLKEKLSALQELASQTRKGYQSGRITLTLALEVQKALLHAELELCQTPKERIAVVEKMVAAAKEYENLVAAKLKLGLASVTEALQARINRLETEIALEREKAK